MLLLLVALSASAQEAPAPVAAPPAATVPAAPVPTPAPAAPVDPAATPVPTLTRIEVPGCGCAVYGPKELTFGPPEKSPDQADVWTGDTPVGRWHFGAVVVKFAEPFAEASPDDLENVLVAYLRFLQGQLGITNTVGVGRGHTQADHPSARGVIDYWTDKDGDRWAVKGWVDANRLAVMFVYGPDDYPLFSVQQVFLDGFRFE